MIRKYVKKGMIVGLICLLVFVSFPTSQADSYHFSNGIIILVGRCNVVESTGLWVFGLTGLYKRDLEFSAQSQEGETMHLMVLSSEIGFFFSKENIYIHTTNTNGFLFWGEKAFLLNNNPQRVIAFCKAEDIWINI